MATLAPPPPPTPGPGPAIAPLTLRLPGVMGMGGSSGTRTGPKPPMTGAECTRGSRRREWACGAMVSGFGGAARMVEDLAMAGVRVSGGPCVWGCGGRGCGKVCAVGVEAEGVRIGGGRREGWVSAWAGSDERVCPLICSVPLWRRELEKELFGAGRDWCGGEKWCGGVGCLAGWGCCCCWGEGCCWEEGTGGALLVPGPDCLRTDGPGCEGGPEADCDKPAVDPRRCSMISFCFCLMERVART
ncbi:hypothetical protein JB92DRAFT_1671204 [Gautieria morchelliformis]|nr:hypothetical protein JB92DRAFT_1671204 [Gautieria morchelliformis]